MDKELADLAEKLSVPIKDHAKKKVTVIDFTDLQGGSTELGKYIAEQLTVNLVMGKREFAVLDRANLKSILAEHKLTSQGLVDPENAKKLGQFAGVDALILGTIIAKPQSINLTAKVITTDTAEIVGAARAEFKSDETVQQLLSRSATPVDSGTTGPSPPSPRKPFGDLQARVESLKLLPGTRAIGMGVLTLIITNMSDSKTYGVALEADPYNKLQLTNDRGDEFRTNESDMSGIRTVFPRYDGSFGGTFTDISPRSSITATLKVQVEWKGKPGDYRPYRLQALLYFGPESKGMYSEVNKYNLVMDIK